MKVLAQGRMSNYFLIKWFCLKLDDLMTRYYQMNHYWVGLISEPYALVSVLCSRAY